jgi:carbon monoxide dehydrogenase subunit G
MARSELAVAAPPATVWEVLSEPQHYAYWVVGSSRIRGWDDEWPEPGSRFYHRIGVGPLTLADHTEVIDADPPRRLALRAKGRPPGVARVELLVEPHPAGSLVTMIEDPDVPLGGLLTPPPVHALVRLRNGESLRRLRKLAERRVPVSWSGPGRPRRARRPSPSRGSR